MEEGGEGKLAKQTEKNKWSISRRPPTYHPSLSSCWRINDSPITSGPPSPTRTTPLFAFSLTNNPNHAIAQFFLYTHQSSSYSDLELGNVSVALAAIHSAQANNWRAREPRIVSVSKSFSSSQWKKIKK